MKTLRFDVHTYLTKTKLSTWTSSIVLNEIRKFVINNKYHSNNELVRDVPCCTEMIEFVCEHFTQRQTMQSIRIWCSWCIFQS